MKGVGAHVGRAMLNANEMRAVLRLLTAAAADPRLLRGAAAGRSGPLVPTADCRLARAQLCVAVGQSGGRLLHRSAPLLS
jgi:hypothetical protein